MSNFDESPNKNIEKIKFPIFAVDFFTEANGELFTNPYVKISNQESLNEHKERELDSSLSTIFFKTEKEADSFYDIRKRINILSNKFKRSTGEDLEEEIRVLNESLLKLMGKEVLI